MFANDRVFFGWLFVESSVRKREFKWRFCILDGAHFSYFRDNAPRAKCLGHHVLEWVERLHCINRGLLLIDGEQRRIWAHAGHETSSFEEWLAVFRCGIDYERRRRDGSIFERPSRDVVSYHGGAAYGSRSYKDDHSVATTAWSREEDLDFSFTGWLVVRKRWLRLNWLYSSASRLYFVLSGRHLSAFAVNVEGHWVDFYGKIARVRPYKSGFWFEVAMEDGRRIRVAGKTPDVTVQWLRRMQRALRRDDISTRRTV